MKTILKFHFILITIVLSSSAFAQSNKNILPKTQTLPSKTGSLSTLNNTAAVSIKKADMFKLKNATTSINLSAIKPFPINPDDLERNRVKSWEITPSRPIVSGFDLTLDGILDKNAFGIRPVLDGNGSNFSYRLYSMYLQCNFMPNKTYLLTFTVEDPKIIPDRAFVIIGMGMDNYEVRLSKSQKQVSLPFQSDEGGLGIIAISPMFVNNNTSDPKSFFLTKVKLEELAPAR